MDIGGFVGRFHPLFVHLPIGLLLLVGVFEYLSHKYKSENFAATVRVTLLLGALSAIFSCISGWLLANQGAYIERSLFLHRWLGISVAIFASFCYLIKTGRINLSKLIFKYLLIIMILGVFITGHYGGQLTHGEDYLLENAPSFIKSIFADEHEKEEGYNFEKPKSIKIYTELLSPVFEKNCWKCHNSENALGGLDLTTKASFLKGGDHDKLIEKGKAYESEFFRRIILPISNKKSMPPAGLPLTFNQIRLIEWWINNGASFEKTLGDFELSSDIQRLLKEEFNISFIQKSAIESIRVEAAVKEDVDFVKDGGFLVNAIAENNNFLDVELKSNTQEKSLDTFKSLLKIKDQISWLTVSNAEITDDQMTIIAQLPNLTKLRLQDNPVTDKGIQKLESLPYLESLNLIETKITDSVLVSIQKMDKLKSIFIWKTNISKKAVEELKSNRPDLEIIQGFEFEKIEE